jgi:diguanylate cyclase (GGDEF)-like protein
MTINTYSLVIILVFFLHSLRSTEKNLLQHKLFMAMMIGTALMLIVDIISRFDGHPGTLYVLANRVGNFTIFLLNPLLPSLWLLYVCCHLIRFGENIKRWSRLLIILNAFNVVLLVLSQFTGWYYVIDAGNIYSRGPLFLLPVAVTAAMLVSAYAMILRHRHTVEQRRLLSLLLFPVPTIVGMLLQIHFYGTSLVLCGATLSVIIAYVTLQSDRLNTDFLTGAYNRKGLETYIRQKINASSEHKTFSGILLDLDNFKAINDSYGHNTGDAVLVSTVEVLKSCLQPNDFIARFGGDEFVIILDISDQAALEKTVKVIDDCFARHIAERIKPVTLDVSIGCAVYDYAVHLSAEEFIRKIDNEMYHHKRAGKAPDRHKVISLREAQARTAEPEQDKAEF